MKFNDQIVSEITAPNNVPFAPGNNVIGIGNQLPPELVAAGILAAILMYSSQWNTANTQPTTKFQYIGTFGGFITLGVGFSNNPSTTPTATVQTIAAFGITTTASLAGVLIVFNAINSSAKVQFVEHYPTGDMDMYFLDTTGNNIILAWSSSQELFGYGANDPLGYGQWQACTLQNGWTATPSPSFGRNSGARVHMTPSGTVHLDGVITPGTVTNGTVIATLPNLNYAPFSTMAFVQYCANATGICLVLINNAGQIIIFQIGASAPSTELNLDCSWYSL